MNGEKLFLFNNFKQTFKMVAICYFIYLVAGARLFNNYIVNFGKDSNKADRATMRPDYVNVE